MSDFNKADEEKPDMYRVGVFIDSADGYFNRRVINDLIDLAEEKKLQLVFFFGGSLDKGLSIGPSSFCYSLPDLKLINAIIVFPNSISPYDPVSGAEKIIEKLPGIPIYSLFVKLPQHFSVVVDEAEAIDEMIVHLVKKHGHKHFSIVTGPRSSESISNARQKMIEESLEKHDIFIPPENVYPGTFSIADGKAVANSIIHCAKKNPDVLICLNDQMAIGAVKEFLNNGVSVPKKIAVVGFDDVEENNFLPCTLTTVDFPIWTMCTVIIEKIANDLYQRTPYSKETVVFDSHFIIRESCGCKDWFDTTKKHRKPFSPLSEKRVSQASLKIAAGLKHSMRDILEKSIATKENAVFSHYMANTITALSKSGQLTDSFVDDLSSEWLLALAQHQKIDDQSIINTLFIDGFKSLLLERTMLFSKRQLVNDGSLRFYRECNELLAQKLSMSEALKGLARNVSLLSISQLYVLIIAPDSRDFGEMRLRYKEGEYTEIPDQDFQKIPLNTLPTEFIDVDSKAISILPISRKSVVYGYVSLLIRDKQVSQLGLIQEMISLLVSTAAENLVVADHIEALVQKNDVLSRLTMIDEFTELHNRKALYHTGRAMYLKAQENRESSCFIFIDMDGLKQINDSYGHTAGDVAIKSLADILKNNFREDDLVVRYGGDEFVVVMIHIQEIVLEKTLSRLANRIGAFNTKGRYKWVLSVSWGVVFNNVTTSEKTFEAILEESDINLYREKRKKKNRYGFSKL